MERVQAAERLHEQLVKELNHLLADRRAARARTASLAPSDADQRTPSAF